MSSNGLSTKKKNDGASLSKRVKGIAKNRLVYHKDFRISLNGTKVLLTEALDSLYPIYTTFDKNEKTLFINVVITYLKDFSNEELSYTDLDDVFSIGTNKVLEYRLFKQEKPDAKTYQSLEKIKKQNEVLKESLATRRKDRLKDAHKSGITILDIAAQFDEKVMAKKAREEKRQLKKGLKVMEESGFVGNKKDIDVGL